MFVRIYPFLRLPRRFGVFDYRVPEGMQVSVGDVVRAPFHGRTIFGAVAACSETTEVRSDVAQILDVTFPGALAPQDVTRLETLAAGIAQSPSTLFFYTYGRPTGEIGMPKLASPSATTLTLPKDMVDVVGACVTASTRQLTTTCQLSAEAALALSQIIRRKADGQLLVTVPRERDADMLARLIAFDGGAAVLHGHTKPKERERIAHAWRQGRLRTLIGTLQATLLPANRLSHVIVLTSGTDDHFSDRRNPRLDTRLTAEAQAAQHAARLLICDSMPRPEDTLAAGQNTIFSPPVEATIVDLRKPDESTGSELITETLLTETKKALQSQKKVLLFYNRKGIAGRAQCRNCGHVITCAACGSLPKVRDTGCECPRCGRTFPTPQACPSCSHGKVGLKGIGNAHIEKDLVARFPDAKVVRIEKGRALQGDADIMLVTEYYFASVAQTFAKKEFGLVADLCLDLSMNPEDFRAAEHTARKLHRLAHFAKQQSASCIVQTWMPDAIEPMRDAQAFLANESAIREQYGLPPYAALVTVRHADADALRAVTDIPFIPNEALLGAMGRAPYDRLPSAMASLATLPDTAVISVDQTYVRSDRPPQSES